MNLRRFFDEDYITVGICAIALAIGYYALNTDFSFFEIGKDSALLSGKNTVAKVHKVKSDVRLRGTKNIFWTSAHRNDSILQGDSLFVGPESTIVVKFKDGKSITIGPNSLIKFKTENQKVKLSLQYGTLKSQDLPDQLVLDDCGNAMDITAVNADLEIGKTSECGNLAVKSTKGTVKINDKLVGKNTSFLNTQSSIKKLGEKPLTNEALLKLENLSPEELAKLNGLSPEELQKLIESWLNPPAPPPPPAPLALPADPLRPPQLVKIKQRVDLKKGAPIAAWIKEENAKEYILETSDNPNFVNAKVTRTPASIQKFDKLSSDKIYYRLKSVGKDDTSSDYSQVGEIRIIYPGIEPVESKIVYDYFAKSPKDLGQKKNFALQWNEIPNANKYVVEVDSNDEFKNPQKYIVRKPASSVEVPGQGAYKFRISAYNAADRKISSTNGLGEIIYNRIFDMKSPDIDKTAAHLTFFFQEGIGKYIWLKWSGETRKNEKFKVEISKNKEFTSVFKSYLTPKNKVLIQEKLPQGQYFWRVRTESDANGGQVSDWSKLGYIEVYSAKRQ